MLTRQRTVGAFDIQRPVAGFIGYFSLACPKGRLLQSNGFVVSAPPNWSSMGTLMKKSKQKTRKSDPTADLEKILREQQKHLALLQQAYSRTGRRALIAIEGHDAAGKGGVIRRIGWALDPRSLRVHAIGAPNEVEARQHWLKRFWSRMPDAGEFVIFDRSWYGRVLVERIQGFAMPNDWQRGYDEIVSFEKVLTDEGVRIVKLLMEISLNTQYRRFLDRYENPAKRWKLTEEDLRNRAKYDEYVNAYEEMVSRTDRPDARWHRIDANDKAQARIDAFQAIIDVLGEGVDLTPPPAPFAVSAFFEKSENGP